ncbi:MAG TPA: HEAT repeat domain-containing protein [Acidimicrobiales bacterium]|nr:HEAT repeat domain-containing protein [Acidimicrobiales bacterium]
MRGTPAVNDFDGWVKQLGVAGRRPTAKRHLMSSGAPALPAVRRGLGHPNPMVRRLCVSVLDHLVDDESVPDLVAALDDDDAEVCRRALHALACDQCKDNACRPADDLFVPRAIELLHSPDPDVRAGAIDALGRVAGRGKSPQIVTALELVAERDPDSGLRSMARRRALRVPRALA